MNLRQIEKKQLYSHAVTMPVAKQSKSRKACRVLVPDLVRLEPHFGITGGHVEVVRVMHGTSQIIARALELFMAGL